MSTPERNINYLNKDFGTLKSQLIEYAKNYFPDTYTDFSDVSPGMMFIEMAAYVGDVLSFYQDAQVQETFLQYAKNPVNLYAMAYMMGYRPKVTTVSEATLEVSQEVGAKLVEGSYIPDWDSTYRLDQYSEVKSTDSSQVSFLTETPVDFGYSSSYDKTDVKILEIGQGDVPASFLLTKKVKAFSGKIKTVTKTFGEYKKYRTVDLVDSEKIIGVLDVVDGNGLHWTEVPFLGQDTVFADKINSGSEGNAAPYTLQLQKVIRRFVTRFTAKNKLELQFGAGMYANDADEQNFLPNPTSLASSAQELSTERYDIAYDPSNFLFSNSYGLAPVGTFTIKYLVGGGVASNVAANTLTKFGTVSVNVRSTEASSEPDMNKLFVTNPEAAAGGRDGDTVEEIRQNSLRSFAEQKRVVTLEDYSIRAISMPQKYGNIAKVYATTGTTIKSNNTSVLNYNPLAVSLYVLAYDVNGKLITAPDIVKTNLKTYLSNYIMLTDAVDLKDAFVVNIGVLYSIVLKAGYRSSDVLTKCSEALKDYFSTDKRSINETLNLSELYVLLSQVRGVQTVKDISIKNKTSVEGDNYSKYAYDITSATRNGVIYPSYDPCIFELKYPDVDIEGRITTF